MPRAQKPMRNEIARSSAHAKERQNSRKRLRRAETRLNRATVPVEDGASQVETGPNHSIALAEDAVDRPETTADGPAAAIPYAFDPPEAIQAPVEYAFDDAFNEAEYLRRHPEVAEAIAEGRLPNALFHFRVFGTRPRPTGERAPPQQNGAGAGPEGAVFRSNPVIEVKRTEAEPAHDAVRVAPKNFGPGSVDALVTSPSGAMFVIGWAAYRDAPLHRIAVQFEDGRSREWPATNLIRFRRPDAENALGLGATRGIGFCGLLLSEGTANGNAGKPRAVTLTAADGAATEFPVSPRRVGEIELRELMLGYLSSCEFLGNKEIEAFFRRCVDDLSSRIGGRDAMARAFHVMAALEGGRILARAYGTSLRLIKPRRANSWAEDVPIRGRNKIVS